MYDPEARRFLMKDPAGMVDGTNLYGYAGGNPVNRLDPSGRWFEGCYGWECRATPGAPPSGGSGGGVQGGANKGSGTSPSSPFGGMRCAVLWTMFGVSVAFALLGLYSYTFISVGTPWLVRLYYAVVTQWTWGVSLAAIGANLWSFVLLILNIAMWVILNIIIPSLTSWFAQIGFWAQFGFKLQSYLMALNIGLALAAYLDSLGRGGYWVKGNILSLVCLLIFLGWGFVAIEFSRITGSQDPWAFFTMNVAFVFLLVWYYRRTLMRMAEDAAAKGLPLRRMDGRKSIQ